MDKSKILSWEEYRKLEYKAPWFFTLNKDGRWLYFLGINHTNDPSNPQIRFTKEKWEEWLKLTENRPKIAFQEGGLRDLQKTEEEAIINDGEPGLLVFLANRSEVEIISPELKPQEELDMLTSKFEMDAVVYYYFARMVDQWLRIKSLSPIESYSMNQFSHAKNYKGWEDYDFSFEHFKQLHKKFLGKDFDENDRMAFNNAINPAKEGTVINDVAKTLQNFRDQYILEQIEKYWLDGKSIFIVYGASHAMRLEPAIKN